MFFLVSVSFLTRITTGVRCGPAHRPCRWPAHLDRAGGSKTKATLTFDYPVEGVIGTATFAHVPVLNNWKLERGEVRER